MKTILTTIFAAVLCMPAFADGTNTNITERTSCIDMQAQITEMSANENMSDADATKLSELRTKYRNTCMRRAGAARGSRTIANARVKNASDAATTTTNSATEQITAPACDAPDEYGCCPNETFSTVDGVQYCCQNDGDICFVPMVVLKEEKPAAPEKTAEEIAAEIKSNIAKGLCGDGTKPNKYGCCGDEQFKDLGGSFACCPKSGGDCFPPISVKSERAENTGVIVER